MEASSESVVIRTFTSRQWDVRGNPKPVNVFAAFGGKRLWIGLIAFVILVTLIGFGFALLVLVISGLVVVLTRAQGKLTPQQHFVDDLMADVNGCIVELTGNKEATLSVKDLISLSESGGDVPLPVNGVSGLSLRVVNDGRRQERVAAIARAADDAFTTRVIVNGSLPDYGTASFDRLLAAALAGSPD